MEIVDHSVPFRNLFIRLVKTGKYVSPRGQLVLESEDFSYRLPPYVRFCNFECRKLNLDYIKAEFLWYLKGDKFDKSITEKASLWKGLVNSDGSINSNYGQYIFGNQFQYNNVVQILENDKDSRRASILILSERHQRMVTNDVPCTYSLNFRIRENQLNMSVHMRSQDGIFGLGNDAPAFSFVHEMLLNSLRKTYPTLECGWYHHIADSFHVYERHFTMLSEITGYDIDSITSREESSPFTHVDCPKISGPEESDFLVNRQYEEREIPEQFAFARWLTS